MDSKIKKEEHELDDSLRYCKFVFKPDTDYRGSVQFRVRFNDGSVRVRTISINDQGVSVIKGDAPDQKASGSSVPRLRFLPVFAHFLALFQPLFLWIAILSLKSILASWIQEWLCFPEKFARFEFRCCRSILDIFFIVPPIFSLLLCCRLLFTV